MKFDGIKNLKDEEWKYIEGTGKDYCISNYGRVVSFCRSSDGVLMCPYWTGKTLRIKLRRYGEIKAYYVSRLVVEMFVGLVNLSKVVVEHINGDSADNRLSNLSIMESVEYKKECVRKMKEVNLARKDGFSRAKLSAGDVSILKALFENGNASVPYLSKVFFISESQVGKILRGKCWKHVKSYVEPKV